MMTFADGLKHQMDLQPFLKQQHHEIYSILMDRNVHRRDRRAARMEREVRNKLNLGDGPIDWSAASFDWSQLLFILQMIAAILTILVLIL